MRHRFHALCPYFAMFPEQFALKWIKELTYKDDIILDPFCGRGTTPFQALLMGRRAIAGDINPVAYCVTAAKTRAPALSTLKRRIRELEGAYVEHDWISNAQEQPEFFRHAYTMRTLAQILYLRESLTWRHTRTDAMVAALILGALHGETEKSPSYLSAQMPRTISTKPAYSIRFWKEHNLSPPDRDAFTLLHRQATFRYASDPPEGRAQVELSDFRDLRRLKTLPEGSVDCVVTSPPYLNVTNFEEDQWLRLWFLGGHPYPTRGRISRDDRHGRANSYWQMIADFWRFMGYVLKAEGHVVIRMAGKNLSYEDVVQRLLGCAAFSRRDVKLVSSSRSAIPRRQTDAFRPGSRGVRFEVDAHFQVA